VIRVVIAKIGIHTELEMNPCIGLVTFAPDLHPMRGS
jgi:hypothetical protein